MKRIIKSIQLLIIVGIIFLANANNPTIESKVNNTNLNRTVNLSTMSQKLSEFEKDNLYSVIDTYTGDLTGYVYNCPACSGRLGCLRDYDLSGGVTTFPDSLYGNVAIVASSSNLPCGTIIRINSSRISEEPIVAIVLDRGVGGNAIDLLSPSYEYATRLGRSVVTYDVLRSGWER